MDKMIKKKNTAALQTRLQEDKTEDPFREWDTYFNSPVVECSNIVTHWGVCHFLEYHIFYLLTMHLDWG